MFHDLSAYGFGKFDFLVKGGLGEDRDVTEVPFVVLCTSWLSPFCFSSFGGFGVFLMLPFFASVSRYVIEDEELHSSDSRDFHLLVDRCEGLAV